MTGREMAKASTKHLPAQTLKIDQSFVREILNDPSNQLIVQAVIGLAGAFQLQVIAEGVETTEQLAVLRKLGCDVGQGYLFARPMPAQQFLEFMRRHDDSEVTAFSAL